MGFISDIIGGGDDPKVTFPTVPQTPEAEESRKRLYGYATGVPPKIPKREIASLPPMTEERRLARKTAVEALEPTEQMDFLSLPEVQGLIQETTVQGNLLANRLSRMLQTSGSLTSSPGRDVLGRTVTAVQKSIASVLAPFASEQRGRAFADRQRIQNLIPVLEGLGLTEEERKRAFEQAGLSAEYEQEYETSKQLETFTIPLLKSIIGLQPGVQPIVQKEGLSTASTLGKAFMPAIMSMIGPMLTAAMSGGGGTGGAWAGTNTAPGFGTTPTPQGTFYA